MEMNHKTSITCRKSKHTNHGIHKTITCTQGSTYFKQHLEINESGGPTNEVRYNPISLAKLANRASLEAICLSRSHDSIAKSMMSSIKLLLVASNSWVCFFSSFRSFWVLSILHLILSPSSLMDFQAASLTESKNVVSITELVTMQNPDSLWLSYLFLYK